MSKENYDIDAEILVWEKFTEGNPKKKIDIYAYICTHNLLYTLSQPVCMAQLRDTLPFTPEVNKRVCC